MIIDKTLAYKLLISIVDIGLNLRQIAINAKYVFCYHLGPVNHQKMCTGTTLFFGPKGYALKIAENALSREPLVV